MAGDARTTLAVIDGFLKPRDSTGHGSTHAAYLICQALAQEGGYSALHVYRDRQVSAGAGQLTLPSAPPSKRLEKLRLRTTAEQYLAIYVANGGQITSAPHMLRPDHDWAPVVCSVGTAHHSGQWANLFLALASGATRATDGLIFKSKAARTLFARTFASWSERFTLPASFPGETTVIPNGVDVDQLQRSEERRRSTRAHLHLRDRDLVFLAFSRLSPGTKGDQQALIVRWKDVVAQVPEATLLLTGVMVDPGFAAELRTLARAAGVGDRVLVLDNPAELLPDGRGQLMSAADVFVHLTTGVEETSSLVVHEAMAHALPVIASDWAGLPEVVTPESGFLVETRYAALAPTLTGTLFAESDTTLGVSASRMVSCNWSDLVAAAVALRDADRRRTMGAAGRRQAEARSLRAVAREYAAFFAETSRAAARSWRGVAPLRPLVDLNDVLAAQATGALSGDQLVRLGDASRAALLGRGLAPEAGERIERVLAALAQGGGGTLSLAALAVAISDAPVAPAQALTSNARFLVRLLNYGLLAPA